MKSKKEIIADKVRKIISKQFKINEITEQTKLDLSFIIALEFWKKLEKDLAVLRPENFFDLREVGEIIKACQEILILNQDLPWEHRVAHIREIIIKNISADKADLVKSDTCLLGRTKRHLNNSLNISGYEYDSIVKDIELSYGLKITFVDTARAKHNTKLLKAHYRDQNNPLDLNSAVDFASYIFYRHSLSVSDWREAKYCSKR